MNRLLHQNYLSNVFTPRGESMKPHWISQGLLCVCSMITILFGCAEERPPINRVQPFALKKSFFIGENFQNTADDPEFWTQGTLVDVGYGAAQNGLFTSTFAQPLSRIKWQVTENLLIGRITYERIEGTDGKGEDSIGAKNSQDGVISVAFTIESHFDISNAYNPTTGEQLNVIQENTTDRPWYEREYMRVDWSQNLNMDSYDFDTLSMLKIFGGLVYEPLKYDITDPSDADAPYFDLEEQYFDVTVKAFVKPEEIDMSLFGWGIKAFPACYFDADFLFGSGPIGNCNPVELTIRHSFRRVVDTDYEPQDWDGYRFRAFGAFDHERTGYARNYGLVDAQWRRPIHRYNIWQRSHIYADPDTMKDPIICNEDVAVGLDPNQDGSETDQADGTADVCAQGLEDLIAQYDEDTPERIYLESIPEGSRCDTFKNRCTLPYSEREVRPMVWYFTKDSAIDYFEATDWATNDWDVAMKMAVRSAKYAECLSLKTRTYCEVEKVKTEEDVAEEAQGGEEERDLFESDVQDECLAEQQIECAERFPIHFGQQTLNDDLKAISWEVKSCLKDHAYQPIGKADNMYESCRSTAERVARARGLKDEDFDAIVSLALMPSVVVLCHSPVEANDHPFCGREDERLPEGITMADCQVALPDSETKEACDQALNVRIGDLRYHQVNAIQNPQSPSPWGIMVDANDPLFGEVVAASINVWTHVNDLWSQKVVDTLRYMKGELSTQEITDGDYVSDWALAAERSTQGSLSPKVTRDELNQRLVDVILEGQEATPDQRQALLEQIDAPVSQEVMGAAKQLQTQLQNIQAHIEAPSENVVTYLNRAAHAHDSVVEAELFDVHVQDMMGVSGLPLSEAVLDRASLLRGGNPALQQQIKQFKELALAERGTCIMQEAPAPHGYGALADLLEEKFGAFNPQESKEVQFARAERMKTYLAQRAQYAVIVHEMGHSVGLRHNFVSSSDAYNYRPQYWQLRTKNGAVETTCSDLSETGEECVGPRYFDPITANERDNALWMWMHSSVMDYAGEATQDMLGLGAYDFAAARSFYGDVHSVYRDPSFRLGSDRGLGVLQKLDNFGGILGFSWNIEGVNGAPRHYSELNRFYELIQDCKTVNPNDFKPKNWDENLYGKWSPTLDGLLVKVNNAYSRCRQQRVDYRRWTDLRPPVSSDLSGVFSRGGNAISLIDRKLRVPYGFGTDSWADLGNLSVYRHDNGADPYELFDFFISQQEVNHIFDHYRRDRMTFSVRGAVGRTLNRFNTKMRDGAKGLGLMKSIYREVALNGGVNANELWIYAATNFFPENILAAGIAFDHFARQLARPQHGPHVLDENYVLRSTDDAPGLNGEPDLLIPNGATGLFETVGIGGRPLENALASDQGEYDNRYTINAGSYYEKLYSAMLMTESVDNFISSSRSDFLDGRFRSVSMADLFPDGYRRWLANNLTNDAEIKGPRLQSTRDGQVRLDQNLFPTKAIGWTSWWGSAPRACFTGPQAILCDTLIDEDAGEFGDNNTFWSVAIDPQVGWEQQKFLIAWTMMYLPENQQQWWIDQLRLWEVGVDTNPEFERRIELHYPEGKSYIARTFGKERIFGKTVQRGIAARVLEYANSLMVKAYVTSPGPDLDEDGSPDWYLPMYHEDTGRPIIRYDNTIIGLSPQGFGARTEGCDENQNYACICESNRACMELQNYMQIPFFLRQTMDAYGYHDLGQRGVW